MQIELNAGVYWYDEKPLHQQSDEAQELIALATAKPVIRRTYETCLDNKRRVTLREYHLTNTLNLSVIPIYNTGPMDCEFMDIMILLTSLKKQNNGTQL